MPIADDYRTISGAADYCGVTRGTIHRWISERQLTTERVGREAVIPKAQLDVVKEISSLGDVVREAARKAGLPVTPDVKVRMNAYLMAQHGKDVLELYDAEATRAWAIRIGIEELR